MKDLKKQIKELKKTAKGKAILFFGFYFFFFLFIMIIARTGVKDTTISSDYERGTQKSFSIADITDKNYAYTYTVTIDNLKYTYTGTRNNDMSLFQYNGINYYNNKEDYYVNNTTWSKCDNPIFYSEFFKDNLSVILSNSSYSSLTSYESGEYDYNLLVSTNTLNQIFTGQVTDYDEEPNKIVVTTDNDRNAYKIKYSLDSYCKLNNLCTNNLTLEIEYSRFGKIENIDNPIE